MDLEISEMNRKLQMTLIFMLIVFSCMISEGQNAAARENKTVGVIDALKEVIGDSNTPEESNAASIKDALKDVIGDSNAPEEPNEVIEGTPQTGPAKNGTLPAKDKEDYPEALYKLGKQYLEGVDDIAKDVPKALELLRQSAELGNSDAMLELAYIYQRGHAIERDESKAIEWLRMAAETGKSIAMLSLAKAFSEGQDPAFDEEERMQWVRKGLKSLEEAAGEGDCEAMRILGMVYHPAKVVDWGLLTGSETWFSMPLLQGRLPGLDKDEKTSAEWYLKAAVGYEKRTEAGDSEAMFWLGKMYAYGLGVEKDVTRELYWYQKAAEAGHREGMVEFGWACHRTQDFENAFTWFTKAAEQGEPEAMMSLGWLYSKGQGVPKDQLEAVKLWRQAADRGHTIAMLSLGAAYANGDGVVQDYPQAFTWYKKGAEAGDATCMFSLGLMYIAGRGVASDPNEAVKWWTKGAEKEHDGCMANLGWIYLNGGGVQKDHKLAVDWFQKAANLGNEYAKKRLAELSVVK